MDYLTCVFCEQGLIHHIKFDKSELYYCDECSSVWKKREDLLTQPKENIETFGKTNGLDLPGDFIQATELEIVTEEQILDLR